MGKIFLFNKGYNKNNYTHFPATFVWMDLGIVGLRVLRLVLTLIGALVFAYGFQRWAEKNKAITDILGFPVGSKHRATHSWLLSW